MIEFEALKGLDEPRLPTYSRSYLGMSGVGGECDRKTLLSWRWTKKTNVPARVQRIFDMGHMLEADIVAKLESLPDVEVQYTGEGQLEFIAIEGHWKGHPDGIIRVGGVSYLLEIKTHKDSNFKKLLKDGVEKGHPAHYDQMQIYMNFDTTPSQAIYIAENKDNCEYYVEVVEIDFNRIESLLERMREILHATHLPPRIGTNKSNYFKCKMCEYSDVCFEKKQIEVNCRTCNSLRVCPEGQFACAKQDVFLTLEDQMKGCSEYQLDGEYFTL